MADTASARMRSKSPAMGFFRAYLLRKRVFAQRHLVSLLFPNQRPCALASWVRAAAVGALNHQDDRSWFHGNAQLEHQLHVLVRSQV
jgi:hypothetical protein